MERASSVSVQRTSEETSIAQKKIAGAKLNLIKRAGCDPHLSSAAHKILGQMVNWANTEGKNYRETRRPHRKCYTARSRNSYSCRLPTLPKRVSR
jgi:hypothetical protein